MRVNKQQLLNALSVKDDFASFEYNKNMYYMYHEGNATVYGWLTPCGFRRSRVVSGRVPFLQESPHYMSFYIKDIVKGNCKLM